MIKPSTKYSFGVKFYRSRPLSKVRTPKGLVDTPNADYVVSSRRFRTAVEANQHGKRFKRIEGHLSFDILAVAKRPNAKINWRTGKTNPLIGLKRTDRR